MPESVIHYIHKWSGKSYMVKFADDTNSNKEWVLTIVKKKVQY